MSTQRYLVGELLQKRSLNHGSDARWDFWMHFTIHADLRSVFYALTMSEYIETWLRAPACRSVSVGQEGSDYSVHFKCDEVPPIMVYGSWLSRHPDHLALTWNRNDEIVCIESIVSMELQQFADRTLLHLYHCGFTSAEQSQWHGELWSSSVERLAGLLEFAGDRPQARICAISPLHRNSILNSRDVYHRVPMRRKPRRDAILSDGNRIVLPPRPSAGK
jgi:uncharacterized protein YndB with AHSA1/START domain